MMATQVGTILSLVVVAAVLAIAAGGIAVSRSRARSGGGGPGGDRSGAEGTPTGEGSSR